MNDPRQTYRYTHIRPHWSDNVGPAVAFYDEAQKLPKIATVAWAKQAGPEFAEAVEQAIAGRFDNC